MTLNEQDAAALNRCCLGNVEAIDFLNHWRTYVHLIDDVVDEDLTEMPKGASARPPGPSRRAVERVCAIGAQAVMLYSHPFYVRNLLALRQVVLSCTNAYADSVMWERSGVPWQAQFADAYRHFGAEMVLAVAGICGGYEHMRSISPELRVICWHEHHTQEGVPI